MNNNDIKPSKITTEAYDIVNKKVGPSGKGGGVIYVPKGWVGCKAQVILLENCDKK